MPNLFKPIWKIILLFDGAPAAVHAIKMFSYVLEPKKSTIKSIYRKRAEKIRVSCARKQTHSRIYKAAFSKATFAVARGNPEFEISNYLKHLPKNQL